MTDVYDIDIGDQRAIKRAQNSYDNIDKREKKAADRAVMADELYIAKMLQQKIREATAHKPLGRQRGQQSHGTVVAIGSAVSIHHCTVLTSSSP